MQTTYKSYKKDRFLINSEIISEKPIILYWSNQSLIFIMDKSNVVDIGNIYQIWQNLRMELCI